MTAPFYIGVGDWDRYQSSATRRAVRLPIGAPRTSTPGVGDAAQFLLVVARELEADGGDVLLLVPDDAPHWLGDVYSLVERNLPDEAVDILFDRIDDLLVTGQFARCDALLRAIDLKRLDSNLIVAVLSITLAAAEKLPYRARLLKRAEERLSAIAPDRVERLLSGLR